MVSWLHAYIILDGKLNILNGSLNKKNMFKLIHRNAADNLLWQIWFYILGYDSLEQSMVLDITLLVFFVILISL